MNRDLLLMNSLTYITMMVLFWPHICLEILYFKGTLPPHPQPRLQFRGTALWRWQCHSHMAGCRERYFHTLLVEIEIAAPFRKQFGNVYPNLKVLSTIKPSHAHISTGMFITALFIGESVNKPRSSQPRISTQSWRRKNGGISIMCHCQVSKK